MLLKLIKSSWEVESTVAKYWQATAEDTQELQGYDGNVEETQALL